MDGTELKELFKISIDRIRKKLSMNCLKQIADKDYQEDAENEGIADKNYLQLDLTDRQREVCDCPLSCRDKQDTEYAIHAYIAGLYDAFRIMAVLFPDKQDMNEIWELPVLQKDN